MVTTCVTTSSGCRKSGNTLSSRVEAALNTSISKVAITMGAVSRSIGRASSAARSCVSRSHVLSGSSGSPSAWISARHQPVERTPIVCIARISGGTLYSYTSSSPGAYRNPP